MASTTQYLVSSFQITLFGRYRCHCPNRSTQLLYFFGARGMKRFAHELWINTRKQNRPWHGLRLRRTFKNLIFFHR
jgi:hypothetical protein